MQRTTFVFPFAPLLAILFIGLKLTDRIDWSWFWVLSPLFIVPLFIVALLASCAVLFGVLKIGAAVWDQHRFRRSAKARALRQSRR